MSGATFGDRLVAALGGHVEALSTPQSLVVTWEPGDGYAYGLLVTEVDPAVVPLLGRWGIGTGYRQITILGVDGVRTWWGEEGAFYHETYVGDRWYGGQPTRQARRYAALINAAVGDAGYAAELMTMVRRGAA